MASCGGRLTGVCRANLGQPSRLGGDGLEGLQLLEAEKGGVKGSWQEEQVGV
jgi:hypothetical protein